jgi:hypothetical protein
MFFDPRIIADPNKSLTSFWCNDGIIESDDVQRRGRHGVKVAVGFIATYEASDANAVCQKQVPFVSLIPCSTVHMITCTSVA